MNHLLEMNSAKDSTVKLRMYWRNNISIYDLNSCLKNCNTFDVLKVWSSSLSAPLLSLVFPSTASALKSPSSELLLFCG